MDKPASYFPEHKFAPVVSNEEYYSKVAAGYATMRTSSCVICCCVKNIEELFPYSSSRIDKLASYFRKYKIIIYESDSSDQTPQLLEEWSRTEPNLEFECEILNNPHIRGKDLERVKLMAGFRNKYLTKVYDKYLSYDYMIVVDPDLNGGWSYDGIAHSFSFDFHMMGSNGLQFVEDKPVFYDTYPYIGINNERIEFYDFLNEGGKLSDELQRGMPLLPVRSCFGGVGIYKISSLRGTYAGGGSLSNPQSEHISLHIFMQRNGFTKHFINPSMICLRHWSDKNFKGIGLGPMKQFVFN